MLYFPFSETTPYTDAVAQALRHAEKIAIVRQQALRCEVPYALEGMMRREIEAAGARLQEVQHGDVVMLGFSLAENAVPAFLARLNELGQGQINWLPSD